MYLYLFLDFDSVVVFIEKILSSLSAPDELYFERYESIRFWHSFLSHHQNATKMRT